MLNKRLEDILFNLGKIYGLANDATYENEIHELVNIIREDVVLLTGDRINAIESAVLGDHAGSEDYYATKI